MKKNKLFSSCVSCLLFLCILNPLFSQSIECDTPTPSDSVYQAYINDITNGTGTIAGGVTGTSNYDLPIHLFIINDSDGTPPGSDIEVKAIDAIKGVNARFTNEISFYLCEITYIDNGQYFDDSGFATSRSQLYNFIYNQQGYTENAITVVINDGSVRPSADFPQYSSRIVHLPRTISAGILAHELGHFFGLKHTFDNVSYCEQFDANGNCLDWRVRYLPDCTANPEELQCTTCDCTNIADNLSSTPVDPGQEVCLTGWLTNSPCYVTTPGGQNLEYNPDYNNIMSYYYLNTFTSEQLDMMLLTVMEHDNRAYLRDTNEPTCTEFFNPSEFANVDKVKYDGGTSTWITEPLPGTSVNIRDNSTSTDYNKTSDSNGEYEVRSSLGALSSVDVTTGQIEANNTTGIFAANYGLSTIDIIKLTQHRSGSPLLPKPYGWIAADVNNDGTIDIDDDSELRKVILGVNTAFPDVPSWRFLPRYYLDAQWGFETSFNNAPFTASISWQDGTTRGYNSTNSYLDNLNITALSEDLENADNWSFYATKSGDLDFSADVSSGGGMMMTMESREQNTSLIVMPHEIIPAGTYFTLVVGAKTKKLTAGYQVGMKFDPSFFEVLSLNQGDLSNFNLRDYNLQNTELGEFKAIWVEDEARGISFSNRKTIFRIHCRAKRDIQNLSRLIILDDNVLETAFYDHKDIITGSEIYISADILDEDIPIILEAVYPNPTSSEISFTFKLTTEKEVSITLQDRTGRSIQHQSNYSVGNHVHRFDNLEALTTGVIHYTISIDNEVKYSGQLIKF